MPKITYVEASGKSHEANVPVGLSVMEGAVQGAIPGIDADCGGACVCATCHVYVDAAWLERVGSPKAAEAEMLEMAVGVRPDSRLSCQIGVTLALDGLVVRMPETQR